MKEQMTCEGAQNEAILHRDGPMLVLAGPGSGKTFTITHRVCHLIEEYRVDPSQILVITFTKAAATEMKERFDALMEEPVPFVSFGTFHAVFFRILKFAYRYDARNIIREDQKTRFVKEEMDRCGVEVEDEMEFVTSILSEISSVKGDMISLDHYYSKNCSEEIFKQLYLGYEDRLRKSNLIDFDDMLVMCHELGRPHMRHLPHQFMPTLQQCVATNLAAASLTSPQVQLAGFSLNTSGVDEAQAKAALAEISREFGVPATDPVRFGISELAQSIKDRGL